MPFVKGRSGNPAGRAKEKPFLDAIRLEIAAAGDDQQALRKVAAKLLKRAMAGDLAAINIIADRLDGKPAQSITNGDDGPFEVVQRVERVIVPSPRAGEPVPQTGDDGEPPRPVQLLTQLGLAPDDLATMREILSVVRTVRGASERPPAHVLRVIRDALTREFGGEQ